MKHHQCPENGDNSASSSTHITYLDQRPDSDRLDAIESPSRRQLLAAAGMLTAATMAASTVGFSSRTGAASTRAVSHQSTHVSPQNRRARALDIREKAALYQLDQGFPAPQNNGDEGSYPAGVVSLSKALPHTICDVLWR